ncbi:hypothetical protein VTL71DRAFT_13541 [Oculimacula yallundae]|uniref:Uncharacterized protein n=1 Tax=Oculimacula yallundae TaxID=86028 RepID=A0ABR4CKR2_9HELO
MGTLKRSASQEPDISTPNSKKQKIIAKINWSKLKFDFDSLPDGTWGTNSLGNDYLSCDNGDYYYWNKDDTSYHKNYEKENAIYITPTKLTFFYPGESESGTYCTGISWRTGSIMTCWKDTRGILVRTPERKPHDDGTREFYRPGVPIRTPFIRAGEDRNMLQVIFLTYKTSETDEIMYEVDEKGLYTGDDQVLIGNLRDITIPERYVFIEDRTRRKLFPLSDISSRKAKTLDSADIKVKVKVKDEKLDVGSSLGAVAQMPIAEIKGG